MAIVLTRVDGRLIHGQVAVAWTRNVSAEKLSSLTMKQQTMTCSAHWWNWPHRLGLQ